MEDEGDEAELGHLGRCFGCASVRAQRQFLDFRSAGIELVGIVGVESGSPSASSPFGSPPASSLITTERVEAMHAASRACSRDGNKCHSPKRSKLMKDGTRCGLQKGFSKIFVLRVRTCA